MTIRQASACPLCGGSDVHELANVRGRPYFTCATCGLVHLLPSLRLGAEAERAHYETHRNEVTDAGYRAFLGRLAEPLMERLAPSARGLDYGSGPGPALAAMLGERGFPTAVFDPFFAPDVAPLLDTYDFVTCTEAFEHFFRPGDELLRLGRLLRPGGILAVMTEVLDEGVDFETWWYRRDPTHVSFYRPRTLEWIATSRGWSLESPGRNVLLFHTRSDPAVRVDT